MKIAKVMIEAKLNGACKVIPETEFPFLTGEEMIFGLAAKVRNGGYVKYRMIGENGVEMMAGKFEALDPRVQDDWETMLEYERIAQVLDYYLMMSNIPGDCASAWVWANNRIE